MPSLTELESSMIFKGKVDKSMTESVDKVGEHLEHIKDQIAELPKGIGEFGNKLLELSGAAFLFDKLQDAVRDLASEWDHLIEIGEEHIAMQSRLQVALENQPHLIREGAKAIQEQKEAIEDLVKSQEKLTTFSGKFTENLAGGLVSMGIKPETGLGPLIKGFENELARRGQLSGSDEDAQAFENALSQAFQGKTRGLNKMFPTLMLGDTLKGGTPDEIIGELIDALEKMPDYASKIRNSPAGQIEHFKHVEGGIEKQKALIAVNLTAPFDDFLAHVEGKFADGPLKWFGQQVETWGEGVDKWVNQVGIPAWDTFSNLFGKEVSPQLQQTAKDAEELIKEFGDATGLSGTIDKLIKMKPEDAIKGIGNAFNFVNEKLEELAKNKDWQDLARNVTAVIQDLSSPGSLKNVQEFFADTLHDLSRMALDVHLASQGKWKELWDLESKDDPYYDKYKATDKNKMLANRPEAPGPWNLSNSQVITDTTAGSMESVPGPWNVNDPHYLALNESTDKLNQKFKDLTDTLTLYQESGIDWLPGIMPSGGVGGGGTHGSGVRRAIPSHIARPEASSSFTGNWGPNGKSTGTSVAWLPNSEGYRVGEEYGDPGNDWAHEGSSSWIGPSGNIIKEGEIGLGSDLAKKYGVNQGDWVELTKGGWHQVTETSKQPWGIEYHASYRGQFEHAGMERDTLTGKVSKTNPNLAKKSELSGEKTSIAGLNPTHVGETNLRMSDDVASQIIKAGKAAGSKIELNYDDDGSTIPSSNKDARKLRSTKDHPVVINNNYTIHGATDPKAVVAAVDDHMKKNAHNHAHAVLTQIRYMQETRPA